MQFRALSVAASVWLAMTAMGQTPPFDDLMKDPGGKAGPTAEAKGNCTENIWLDITIDDIGNSITWQVIRVLDNSIAAQGGPYPNGSGGNTVTNYMCLNKECYRLVVLDDDGNGIDQGSYVLRDDYGNRIIVADGEFGASSQIANSGEFCLPLSNQGLIDSWCDRTDLTYSGSTQLYASFQPGATGYQFWLYDPHGTYTRRVFRTSQNLWPTYLYTNPVPADLDLNVKVRALVNGQYTNFGRACVIRLNSVVPPSTRSLTLGADAGASMTMFPNPGRGGEVRLQLEGLPALPGTATVDYLDLSGRLVANGTLAHDGERYDGLLPGSGDLRTGTYVVRVQANERTITARLVVL